MAQAACVPLDIALPCAPRALTVVLVRPADLAVVSRARADLASVAARAAREASGVSAAELARALRVTRQAVSSWETGKSVPSAAHALAYARALAAVTRQAA